MGWGKLLDSGLHPRNPSFVQPIPTRRSFKTRREKELQARETSSPRRALTVAPLAALSISTRLYLGSIAYPTSLTWNVMCGTVGKRITDRDKKRFAGDRYFPLKYVSVSSISPDLLGKQSIKAPDPFTFYWNTRGDD
jgi:hypothetical protein